MGLTNTVPTITLSSCVRAASAAETRYRVDVPIAPSRGVRVIALDPAAAVVAGRAAAHEWATAHFLVAESPGGDHLSLRGIGGSSVVLEDQLDQADVVLMIATEDSGAAAASALGHACALRGIMTAGIVLGAGDAAEHALAALRPYARVLLPSADESDVTELLTALRA
jgi:cysteine synthase